ncbi:ABC transporter permease [Aestuariivirga sp.]|uniref:ABC transporter permease n=1 Tax=Aestuariivirga sp. TaxID=2650926 RepID=UPI003593BBAA
MRQPVGQYPGLKLWTALFFVFLYAPMVVLVAYSFNENKLAMIWGGFSLKWYVKIFTGGAIGEAAMNSLFVAVIATSIAVVIAIASALVLVREAKFKGAGASNALISMPLIVPEIVTAVATLMFFVMLKNLTGFDLGLGNIVIAHTVFCIPFAFMPIRARLQDMDMAVEYAARDLYASAWNAFRYVTLPLLMPGVIAGAMLAFVISLDDFIITQMISGPGTTTLPVYIYSMIRNGITPEVNAASTILIAVSTALVTVYWYVSRPKKA